MNSNAVPAADRHRARSLTRAALRLSHIWRPIDPRLASNRLALVAPAVVAAVGALLVTVLTDVGTGGGIVAGLRYGVGAFLAWAVARELDPDHPASARAAMLVYVVAAWAGPPDLMASVAVLVTLRVVIRTTGSAPTPTDLVILAAVAGLAATSTAGFVAALGLAWALHADRRLPDPGPDRTSEIAAAATAALAVAVTMVSGAFVGGWDAPGWLDAVLIVAAGLAATALRTAAVAAVGDRTGEPLHIDRLVHGRRLTLVVLLGAVAWSGASAIAGLAPTLAAVIGVGSVSAGIGARLARFLPSR